MNVTDENQSILSLFAASLYKTLFKQASRLKTYVSVQVKVLARYHFNLSFYPSPNPEIFTQKKVVANFIKDGFLI